MANNNTRTVLRKKRHQRIRKNIVGTALRPRLSVFRSAKNISVQLIDDVNGVTLVSATTTEKDNNIYGGNVAAAKKVGTLIAERALAKNIKTIIFDRSGYLYHGRVKALAEAAREAGLEF